MRTFFWLAGGFVFTLVCAVVILVAWPFLWWFGPERQYELDDDI